MAFPQGRRTFISRFFGFEIQRIHSTCCIMIILEKLTEIFVDQSISNITNVINNVTVLVRDYEYDSINQQH